MRMSDKELQEGMRQCASFRTLKADKLGATVLQLCRDRDTGQKPATVAGTREKTND